MNFERTLAIDISSDFMPSKVGWGGGFHGKWNTPSGTVPCLSQTEHQMVYQSMVISINLRKIILQASWMSRYIYIMACNSNAAAAIGSCLSSKNSPHQTIRAHTET